MSAIITLFLLIILGAALLLRLGRLAVQEARRTPQHNTLQQRFARDRHERSQWQMFTVALSAGTLPELREHMK